MNAYLRTIPFFLLSPRFHLISIFYFEMNALRGRWYLEIPRRSADQRVSWSLFPVVTQAID